MNDRVQKFQLTPNSCPIGTTQIAFEVCFVTKWGQSGAGNGQFFMPGGIAVDPSGKVYVDDIGNNRTQIFKWKPIVANPAIGGIVAK
jgi:DNA-binding beta-propeller fold protein YncE